MADIIAIPDFDDKSICQACLDPEPPSMIYVEKSQIINFAQGNIIRKGMIEKTCARCGYKWVEYPAYLTVT